MFTNTLPPRHAPQAAARLNGRARTFVTAKIRQSTPLNRHPYINTWQWLPTLYTKNLTQNGRLYLCYPRSRAPGNPASQIEGPQEAKKRERDCRNVGSYLTNPSWTLAQAGSW